jgi:hypothetical protein
MSSERQDSSGIPVWLTVTVGTLLVTALILTGIFHGKIDHKRSAPVATVTASVPPVCEDVDQSTPCLLMPAPSGIERNAQPYPACDPDDRTPCAPVAVRKLTHDPASTDGRFHRCGLVTGQGVTDHLTAYAVRCQGYRHLTVAEARQWTDPLGKRLTPACIVKFGDTTVIRCPDGYVQES